MQGVSAEWSYNMALVACGRAGRAAEAVDVFARMLSAGMRPSLSTYTALMSLFCRAGALREAAFVLEGMQAAGLQPNTITYSSLINGCEKAGSLPEALRYFEEMLVRSHSAELAQRRSVHSGAAGEGRAAVCVAVPIWMLHTGGSCCCPLCDCQEAGQEMCFACGCVWGGERSHVEPPLSSTHAFLISRYAFLIKNACVCLTRVVPQCGT